MLIYFNSPPLIGQHTRDIMEDLGFGENTIQQVAKHTETSLMNFRKQITQIPQITRITTGANSGWWKLRRPQITQIAQIT